MRSTLKWIVGVCCLIGIYWVAQSRSILDALALSLCAGGLVWILFDQRIENLKTRLAILERGETNLQESVESLGNRMDAMHDSVDALYESVDKLSRRVDYHSEWCQSLQERIAVQHNITPDSLGE